jgi:hypothetical protein
MPCLYTERLKRYTTKYGPRLTDSKWKLALDSLTLVYGNTFHRIWRSKATALLYPTRDSLWHVTYAVNRATKLMTVHGGNCQEVNKPAMTGVHGQIGSNVVPSRLNRASTMAPITYLCPPPVRHVKSLNLNPGPLILTHMKNRTPW